MASNEEILTPQVLIVPQLSSSVLLSTFPKGMLVLSGAKLYIAVNANTWEEVTSS